MYAYMLIFVRWFKQLTETYSRNNKDIVITVCSVGPCHIHG